MALFNLHARALSPSWVKLLCSWLLLLGLLDGQQNVPTFWTRVFLVHVDVEVLGQDDRPIVDLGKEDFRVFDGGQEQIVVALSRDEQPLDLILLFDVSGSMRKHVAEVAKVAHEAFKALHPGDRVSVMVFNRSATVVAPFSEDLAAIEDAIASVAKWPFGGGTWIQDSIHTAAECFLNSNYRDSRRRAILIVTDNFGRPSRHKKAILASLWEADALLSGVVVTNHVAQRLALPGTERRVGIQNFVEQTGGDMIRSDDLSTSFPEMMHRIRNRYTLYYKLPDGKVGDLRRIDVQLSQRGCERYPGARVLARRAYRLRAHDQYGFTNR